MNRFIALAFGLLMVSNMSHANDYVLGGLPDAEKRSVTEINKGDVSNNDALDALEAALRTNWQVTRDWSSCSRTCGTGTQTRELYCPPGFDCGPKPATSRSCNTHACSWTVGSYGSCNKGCGGGTQWRSVTCPYSGACTSSKPATSRSCNTQLCGVYKYLASGATACDYYSNLGKPRTTSGKNPGTSCSAADEGKSYYYTSRQCASVAGQPKFVFSASRCTNIPQYMWVATGNYSSCYHSSGGPSNWISKSALNTACASSQRGTERPITNGGSRTCGTSNVHRFAVAECMKQW